MNRRGVHELFMSTGRVHEQAIQERGLNKHTHKQHGDGGLVKRHSTYAYDNLRSGMEYGGGPIPC